MPASGRGHSRRSGPDGKKLIEALRWRWRFSANEVEYLRAKGAPVLAEEVKPESPWLWQAFHFLRGSRGSQGSIPLGEIMAYADECGIGCPVQRHILLRAVLAMDNAELEHGRSRP